MLAAAANAEDLPLTQADTVKVGNDATTLGGYKMPGSADPKGYYPLRIVALRAVGDNADSGATSFAGIMLALAPLKQLKTLTPEIKKTTGV